MIYTKKIELNSNTFYKEIWKNGVRNLPTRIEIIMERKKNEDEEEGQEKMYTLVKLSPAFKTE